MKKLYCCSGVLGVAAVLIGCIVWICSVNSDVLEWFAVQAYKGFLWGNRTYIRCNMIRNSVRLHNVEMVYSPASVISEKMPEMRFIKKGVTLLSVTSKQGNLSFVKEIDSDIIENKTRLGFGVFPGDRDFDYRKYLLDLHGNGDCRYLIIADTHSGNSAMGHSGYVIDTKDNFKIVCVIDTGEAMDVPYFNRELIFNKHLLHLGTFGTAEEIIAVVPARYNTSGEPEFMKSDAFICDTAISAYWNKGFENSAIARLYAFMLSRGAFKDAKKIAARYEYTDAFIEKTHAEVVKKIKASPHRKIIEKLNNIDVDKM